jgi:hypothetical protein
MPLMKITTSGLVAITCSVALLWACVLGERIVMNRAYAERAAVMRSLARQRHTRSVRAPRFPFQIQSHSVAG